MADVYFGFGGNDTTGDGSQGNPYLTYFEASLNSVSYDSCILIDGVAVADSISGSMDIGEARYISALNYRAGVITPSILEVNFCVKHTSSIIEAENPHTLDGIVFDGKDQVTTCYESTRIISQQIESEYRNCEFKGGKANAFRIRIRRGVITIINCLFNGLSTGKVISAQNMAGDGSHNIIISNIALNNITSSTSIKGVTLTKIDNLTNSCQVRIENVVGAMGHDVIAGAVAAFIEVIGVDSPVISRNKITLTSDHATEKSNGIIVKGLPIAVTAWTLISDNIVNFFCNDGFGVALGDELIATNTSGSITCNNVTGRVLLTHKPVNILVGMSVTAELKGNISRNGYVGYLLSLSTSVDAQDNTAIDCIGASYLVKGTVSSNVIGNLAIITEAVEQIDSGILTVSAQGVTDTLGAVISSNTVIVRDVSKIHALAQITDALQVCTFSDNIYIIPDTVDLLTEILFCHNSLIPNNLFGQWVLQSRVSGDRVFQMPVSAIDDLIASVLAGSAGGSTGAGTGGKLTLNPLSLSSLSQ